MYCSCMRRTYRLVLGSWVTWEESGGLAYLTHLFLAGFFCVRFGTSLLPLGFSATSGALSLGGVLLPLDFVAGCGSAFSTSSSSRLLCTFSTWDLSCSGVSESTILVGSEWTMRRFTHPLWCTQSLLLVGCGMQQLRHLACHVSTFARVFLRIRSLMSSALHRSYGMASQKIW